MTIDDKDSYVKYRNSFAPIFQRYQGEVVAYDDFAQVIEGQLEPGRTVILKFPDKATALEWFNSEDYQHISKFRHAGVRQHFALLMGERPDQDEFV